MAQGQDRLADIQDLLPEADRGATPEQQTKVFQFESGDITLDVTVVSGRLTQRGGVENKVRAFMIALNGLRAFIKLDTIITTNRVALGLVGVSGESQLGALDSDRWRELRLQSLTNNVKIVHGDLCRLGVTKVLNRQDGRYIFSAPEPDPQQ